MNTQAIMNNFWLTQWATSQCRNSKPVSEDEAIIIAGVLLVLFIALIAFCVWLWWESRPLAVDIVAKYQKERRKTAVDEKMSETPNGDGHTCTTLGAVDLAAAVLSQSFLLTTTTHQTKNKKENRK